MLNPDGVVNGNYRTSLAGVDLNRRWDNPDSSYHPTVFKTKEMIKIFQTKLEVVTLCDIHGHSRKQGLFMYGCGLESRRNNIRSYITTYTFPKLFDKNCEFFNLPGCTFKMQVRNINVSDLNLSFHTESILRVYSFYFFSSIDCLSLIYMQYFSFISSY